ncbi:DNA-dependent ATPase mgs1 [Microbotryomycetes sp. JL201]|nr:DNA-dependent ATPase mgs1 [Microbotryomycetes sp. JL201]
MAALPTPDGTPAPDEQQLDVETLLAQGVRSLALKKWPEACEDLSRAVEALAEKYGEFAPECAEPLVLYGRALLNNAIAQSAVLGGGPDGHSKEETEEAAQNAAGSSSAAAGPSSNRNFSFGGDGPDDEDENEDEEGDDEQEEEAAAVDRDDELEAAFGVLDMARTIYEKMDTEDAKVKRADVHKLLGEVAQESAQFENAVEEYTSALDILQNVLPPYDRALSELHMLCALALDFLPDSVSRAVKHAERAKDVLLLKLAQLEKAEHKTERDNKEIADIKDLLGDIEDLKVVPEELPKTEAERRLDELLKGSGAGSASGAVNNLNSLVKKKAKSTAPPPAPIIEEAKLENAAAAGHSSAGSAAGKRKAADEVEEAKDKKLAQPVSDVAFDVFSHLDGPDCAVNAKQATSSPSTTPSLSATSKGKQKARSVDSDSRKNVIQVDMDQDKVLKLETQSINRPAKRFKSSQALQDVKPLAERMRPTKMEELVGQRDLLGEGALLRRLIEQDRLGSLILWGPPGSGKTTLARVIAQKTSSVFKELSATSASVGDLRKLFDEARNLITLTGRKTIVFIDEIQRFTKAQQDHLLPVVESGVISLIASTTENPSFRVNNALLSRCRVFVLHKLEPDDLYKLLVRALRASIADDEGRPSTSSSDPDAVPPGLIDQTLLQFLASAADGDARVALSSLELAMAATKDTGRSITRDELKAQLRKAHLQYDRTGDHHYDTISALHKSVRGSDADASLFWLARMLEGGDDPLYVARRLIRIASEDVGLANPQALPQAVAAYQACLLVGMPECDVALAQTVVMLAESPKSVRVYQAYKKAKTLVREQEQYPVPMHLRNAPTKLMKDLGYGRSYRWDPAYAHPVYQPFLPEQLEGTKLLQEESDIQGKEIDFAALEEWEAKRNRGNRWQGRDALLERLEERSLLADDSAGVGPSAAGAG